VKPIEESAGHRLRVTGVYPTTEASANSIRDCELNLNKSFRFWRCLKYVALSLLLLIVLAVCAIHVQERILRHRAENLLENIRSLELRKANFADTQKVFQRWKRWAKYEGECSEAHCDIRITLQDFPLDLPERYAWRMNWPRHASMLVGGHPSQIISEIFVENGIVWGKGFDIVVLAPPYSGAPGLASLGDYSVIGSAESWPRFSDWEWSDGAYFHPNYSIVVPSACEVCVTAMVKFTPYADSKDVNRLMQFNFSCLTRWKTCRMPIDIMPVAWDEHLADRARMASTPPPECARDRMEFIGRDSENAAIVEAVVNEKKPSDDDDRSQAFSLRLVKRIKRAQFWDIGSVREVGIIESRLRLVGFSGLDAIHPGDRLIIFFRNGGVDGVTLQECGALPFTAENVAIVARGVQQNYAAFLPEREK
jgi:hypothetical protein